MKFNEEFIQLPPMNRETDGLAVQMIWEYMKLPDELKTEVYEDLLAFNQGKKLGELNVPEKYQKIELDEIADYKNAIEELIGSLILEVSDIACWVFAKKYVSGWTLEQMLEDMPKAEKFIVVLDTLYDKHIKFKDEEDIPMS